MAALSDLFETVSMVGGHALHLLERLSMGERVQEAWMLVKTKESLVKISQARLISRRQGRMGSNPGLREDKVAPIDASSLETI